MKKIEEIKKEDFGSLRHNRYNGFTERLSKLITATSETQTQFANQIGTSKAVITSYLTGKNYPQFDILFKIKEYTDIDLNWLVFGEDS